jgi:hypothetical protein
MADTPDYSSTQAPETRKEAEEKQPLPADGRLHPGGSHGTAHDPGMSSLDRADTLSGGESTGQEDYGQPATKRPV